MKLSKTQNLTTAENRKRMKVIPYASVIGSIKVCHAMDQNYCILCPGLAREYNSDLIRRCFSIMDVIKEFVVKVTSMQTFTLIQMTLSLNLDTY